VNAIDPRTIKPRAGAASPTLRIGLINNMPAAASSATERQFRQVLAEARNEQDVDFLCFRPSLGDTGGGPSGLAEIFEADLDGIIVTGTEPQSSNLREEPIWALITRLADFAEEHALPVIWSCLSAHAAILYLDGVDRVRLDSKLSGLYKGEVVATDHPLVQGLDAWAVPHSRCNDLPEEALLASGYQVLLRSPGAGVDLFQKASNPEFVFLQSHPEYDSDSLRREFQRDVRRFLAGERRDPPARPQFYFESMSAFLPPLPEDWSMVRRENAEAILAWLGRCTEQSVKAPWRPTAVALYRNWLRGLAARKAPVESEAAGYAGQARHQHDLQEPGLVPC
jgi:homoserine O-succinyltransferase/O-acetyltransferase